VIFLLVAQFYPIDFDGITDPGPDGNQILHYRTLAQHLDQNCGHIHNSSVRPVQFIPAHTITELLPKLSI
jgi:hypothetical protein